MRTMLDMVVTYQMGASEIALCESHASDEAAYDVRSAPIGAVQYGAHRGRCAMCERLGMYEKEEEE